MSSIPKVLQNRTLPMSPDGITILVNTDNSVLTLHWFHCQSFSVYGFKYLPHPFSEGPCSYHLFFIFRDLFFNVFYLGLRILQNGDIPQYVGEQNLSEIILAENPSSICLHQIRKGLKEQGVHRWEVQIECYCGKALQIVR